MKKSLLALAALTAFAGAASAQSSVTLFGIVDVNVRNQDNGSAGSRKNVATDGNASSRIGFRGVEDIGGGLKAGFWLEGALAADIGTLGGSVGNASATAGAWNRRATVSLMGNFGEIRLGRDYVPSFWNHTVFDVFGTNGVGSTTNGQYGAGNSLGSGATTFVRANNSVGYFLPALGGVYGQVMVAAGEGAVGNKYVGGRIGYSAGPINVGFAYGKTDMGDGSTPDFEDMNLGVSFNAGFATFTAQAAKGEFGGVNQKTFYGGVGIPLGAATLKASFTKYDGNLANKSLDAKQIAVGVVYDLSKRTAVYGHFSRLDNGGSSTGARFTTSGSGPAFSATQGGQNSTGYEFGVRHSF